MADEELLDIESGENVMLREAVEALRQDDRARARDLLTRLLKTDQNNAAYWVWLSAAVETQKERLYCLQNALRIDPQNAAAKRGLVLLGALPPDDSIPPFPINRPRQWEDKLVVAREPQEKPRGWANPLTRVIVVLGVAALGVGLFLGGYSLLGDRAAALFPGAPARPLAVTLTFTPTATPLIRTATPTFLGPTPLAFFLQRTYTPTPFYVVTEHPVLTRASFMAGLRSLASRDYRTARVQFQQVLVSEPEAVDVYFYLGESYRMEGDYRRARDFYQQAISRDANFAPPYLARARANLAINPEAVVIDDLNSAVRLDSRYAEAYIERGKYLMTRNPSGARSDLRAAIELAPESALAHLYLAQVQLLLGENEAALGSALRANEIDMTLVPVYLALAQAYIATGQAEQAVAPLQTYTLYEPGDINAVLRLGIAYNALGDYQLAVNVLDRVLQANPRSAEAYTQRGLAQLNLGNANLAESDLKLAVAYAPTSFDAHIGLARAYDMRGYSGDAYIQVEVNAHPLAKTNEAKAQVYYWEAVFLEKTNDIPGARASWYRLLTLPADSMPAEWRDQAFQALGITPTFTPTPRQSPTPTSTPEQ